MFQTKQFTRFLESILTQFKQNLLENVVIFTIYPNYTLVLKGEKASRLSNDVNQPDRAWLMSMPNILFFFIPNIYFLWL